VFLHPAPHDVPHHLHEEIEAQQRTPGRYFLIYLGMTPKTTHENNFIVELSLAPLSVPFQYSLDLCLSSFHRLPPPPFHGAISFHHSLSTSLALTLSDLVRSVCLHRRRLLVERRAAVARVDERRLEIVHFGARAVQLQRMHKIYIHRVILLETKQKKGKE